MFGPDAISAATRVPQVQLEARSLWVQTPVAQQLGLRDGQIVQAIAEVRDQRVRLWLKDFFFELPNGWVLKDGDKPFLRVNHTPGGWGFLIQAYPTGQGSTATPASAGFGHTKALDVHGPQQLNTAIGLLLTQPSGFASFSKLMNDMDLGLWRGQGEMAALVQRLLQQRSAMAQMNPTMLKRAVMGQARSLENVLSQAQTPEDDLKGILKQLLAMSQEGAASGVDKERSRELEAATRELEAAQTQGAQKWLNGDLSLHVVLPFIDADPVELHFQKPARKPGQEETPLSVDIHSRSRLLGEIWLNTVISQSTSVDLVMWALRSDVAGMARQRAGELGLELGAAGLKLHSFQIFNAPRPLVRAGEASGTRGSVIDTTA
ncbi:MAG: hypothetical protein RI998_1247 [Pseudomonadota bacterium]